MHQVAIFYMRCTKSRQGFLKLRHSEIFVKPAFAQVQIHCMLQSVSGKFHLKRICVVGGPPYFEVMLNTENGFKVINENLNLVFDFKPVENSNKYFFAYCQQQALKRIMNVQKYKPLKECNKNSKEVLVHSERVQLKVTQDRAFKLPLTLYFLRGNLFAQDRIARLVKCLNSRNM